jgi:hypothetical protein
MYPYLVLVVPLFIIDYLCRDNHQAKGSRNISRADVSLRVLDLSHLSLLAIARSVRQGFHPRTTTPISMSESIHRHNNEIGVGACGLNSCQKVSYIAECKDGRQFHNMICSDCKSLLAPRRILETDPQKSPLGLRDRGSPKGRPER